MKLLGVEELVQILDRDLDQRLDRDLDQHLDQGLDQDQELVKLHHRGKPKVCFSYKHNHTVKTK
jgi:hypothetical protein